MGEFFLAIITVAIFASAFYSFRCFLILAAFLNDEDEDGSGE